MIKQYRFHSAMKRPLPCPTHFRLRRSDGGVRWGTVLWLLPYLIFTAFGRVPHTHELGDKDGVRALATPYTAAWHIGVGSETGHEVALESLRLSNASTECLACLWAFLSLVHQATPQVAREVPGMEVHAVSSSARILFSTSLCGSPGRSPPLRRSSSLT